MARESDPNEQAIDTTAAKEQGTLLEPAAANTMPQPPASFPCVYANPDRFAEKRGSCRLYDDVYPTFCLAAMAAPAFTEFHKCRRVLRSSEALGRVCTREYKSVGTNPSGEPLRVNLICYKCAGTSLHGDESYFRGQKKKKGALSQEWLRK